MEYKDLQDEGQKKTISRCYGGSLPADDRPSLRIYWIDKLTEGNAEANSSWNKALDQGQLEPLSLPLHFWGVVLRRTDTEAIVVEGVGWHLVAGFWPFKRENEMFKITEKWFVQPIGSQNEKS